MSAEIIKRTMKGFDIMVFLYDITYYFSYFLVMIVFLAIAIVLGNRPAGWTTYGIGAFIQFLSLVGLYNSYQGYPYFGYGFGEEFGPYIIIYTLLLIIAGFSVALHRPKSKKNTDNITTENNSAYEDPQLTEEQFKRQQKSDLRDMLVLLAFGLIICIIVLMYKFLIQ